MRYGSVCSGIEAASLAWEPLGWSPAWFAEIEPFACAVLKHRWPHVPNLGDMTTIHERREFQDEPIDVLVGGTPCQSFSVAGLRGGMADPRGNLALVFLGLVERKRPRWVVWENVPGVRSADGGRALGAFLGGLGQLGYGWAYRSLDAQYFNLGQRRERVFVVGHSGGAWQRAWQVLFEPASLCGDSPPRREAGERVARPIAAGSPGGSGYRNDADTADNLIEISPALRAVHNSSHRADSEAYVAMTLNAHGGSGRLDAESETFVVAHSLRADSFNAGEDGTGRGTPIIAFNARQDPDSGEVTHALDTDGSSIGILAPSMGVRRIMPVEAERLMGMPDGHTAIQYRGKPAADGPRYRAIGNSWAVPAANWIGRRIALAEAL